MYNGGFFMIKTVNLTGSEIKVTELGGDNTEIFNNGKETIYASKLPNITVGGDDVIAIPAGATDGLYGTGGTLYLFGSGNVELRGNDKEIIIRTRGQSNGDSLGVFADYVDDKSSETLDIAKTYTDVKDSEVIVNVKEYADSLYAELSRYIGYTDNDIYGLEADFENCKFTRLAGSVGKEAGADFDSVNAYGGRRRCNLSDDGEVLAYYGDEDFKADGSNGQVMVEQPAFYYKVVPLKINKGNEGYILRKARYYISDTPKAGFKLHPAFIENNKVNDKIYLAAYEACIYDTSKSTYCTDNTIVADFDIDKLSSIADAKPASGEKQNLTLANTRRLAQNRGKGWEQSYMATVSATEMLMIIEYASFNMEQVIGSGNTVQTNNTSNIKNTGRTNDLGNTTGLTDGDDSVQFITYRGEENFYGNVWTWVDGGNAFYDANMNGCGKLYVADHDFADDTGVAPYRDTGIIPCSTNGYISAFGYSEAFDWLFIAAECKGKSDLPIGDYFWYTRKNWVNTLFGGCCYDSLKAGAFNWSMYNLSSSYRWDAGGRLVYVPSKASKK